MLPAPTTPTILDRQAAVRKLNLEIAGLTAAKDVADRAAREAQGAAEDARARSGELSKGLETLQASMEGAGAEIREFVAECRNALQASVMILEDAAAKARDIAAYVQKLTFDVKQLEEAKCTLLDSISRENRLISAQRADLDIYHERIKKAAAEHLPGHKIEIPLNL